MMNQPLSTEELYQMVEGLNQQIETLSHEKSELELLLEISTEHGDFIINHLLILLKQYEIEKIQQKKIETKLRAELATVMKDKADLEILLEATVEHGDTVEEELHNRSIRDPLTGLFNRRYLEQFLVRAMNEAKAENYPIAMIMIDIDHFKNFNNTFGHDAGDIVLKTVSEFLIKSISSTDMACRYGGEELTLILPRAVPEETYNQAEKIRLGVKQLQLQHQDQILPTITLSLGIAFFPTHGTTWETVLKAADTALYYAKAQGRDQVAVAREIE